MLLGGKYKQMFEERIQSHVKNGSLESWYLGVSEDPWQHHFEQDNYIPVSELKNKNNVIHDGNYLKIGKWHGVTDWKGAFAFFISSYKQMLESLI